MFKRFILPVFCIIAIISSSIYLPQVFSSDDLDCAEKEKNLEDAEKAFNKAKADFDKQNVKVFRMGISRLGGKTAQKDPLSKKIGVEIERLQYFSDVATIKHNELEAARKVLEQTCNHKHGISGETGVIYYACEPDTSKCHRSSEHWIPCRGGCGELFPPSTVSVNPPAGLGSFGFSEIKYYDHEAVCEEPVYSWWNPSAKCGKKYFTCQGGCPHRSDEGVFFNQSRFKVYDTLAVRVIKDDLYIANMYIDGSYVTAAYPGSGGEATLSKTFNSGDAGKTFTVTIYVYYADDGVSSTSHTATISVE